MVRYILPAQLLRMVDSTSSPLPPQMRSWPFHNHIILVLALVLGCQVDNAIGCRNRTFIVDSLNLDAGITYSGGSWVTEEDDPSAGVFFFGGSTMRTFSNGDSVEFVFTGPSNRPFVPTLTLPPFGRSIQRLTRVMVGGLQETPLRSSEMSGRSMQTSPLRWTAALQGKARPFLRVGSRRWFHFGRRLACRRASIDFVSHMMTSLVYGFLWTNFGTSEFDPACEKRRCTHAVHVLSRYRKNDTGVFDCPLCDRPSSLSTSTLEEVQTSLEPGDSLSAVSSSPESTSSIPDTSPSSTSPLSWDMDPLSSITPSATAPPENAVPWISDSTSSPTASAAAVVNLDAVTVGGIIGITIGGTALGMVIVVCCFFAWRHRRSIFKDRRKSLGTQTIKSERAPTITPYHWPPESDPSAELKSSKPVPEMVTYANTLPESVAEVETASEQEVDLGK